MNKAVSISKSKMSGYRKNEGLTLITPIKQHKFQFIFGEHFIVICKRYITLQEKDEVLS